MPLAISGRKAATTEYEKSRRSKFLAKALAFLLMMFMLFPVFADDEADSIALNMFDYITGYTESDGTVTIDAGEDVKKVIAVDFSSDVTTIGGVDVSFLTKDGGVIDTINDTCMGIAIALSIAMFCVSWMQAYLNGNVSDEAWLQKFMVFGMSLLGIVYARQLTMLVATLGSGIAERIATTTVDNNVVTDNIVAFRNQIIDETVFDGGSVMVIGDLVEWLTCVRKSIKYVFTFALPCLVVLVCNLVVWLQAWSRAIEILIIAAMSPFGFLGIERGVEGPVRYVKQVFALGIQGAIMMVVIVVCKTLGASAISSIASAGFTGDIDNFWSLIIIDVVEIGMLQRSRQIAQSIVT